MYTKDQFVQSYLLLASPDPVIKDQANHYIMELLERDEAWLVARQLLDSGNLEHMFFGAQILYQKTEYSFAALDVQIQQELRGYVFALIVRLCDEKVTSCWDSCSDWLLNDCRQLANVLVYEVSNSEDLVGIMKKSVWHLRACLEIIDYSTDAIKNLRGVRQAEREYVRNEFMRRQDLLFQIFNDVFHVDDATSITRNLQCLESWCKFTLPVMKNPTTIKNILQVCLRSEENFDLAGEIIASCFRQINCANVSEATSSVVLKEKLDANELENLVAIVRFLLENLSNLYGPNNCQYVGDRIVTKASSHLCRIYTFIIQRVLVEYPWIVTEDTQNNSGKLLLQAMVTTLKHRSLEVSDIALELFYQFYGQVSKLKQIQQEDFKVALLNCYVEVHRIVLSRAQRNRMFGELVPVEEEEMEDDDAEQGEGDLFKITFAQYRKDCRQFFACVYQVFKELAGRGGAAYFFEPVLALLQPLPNDPLASNKIEAALFAVSSCMISLTADDDNHSYLQRILTYVCTNVQPTTNPNVRAESFRLLSNCSREVNSKPELFVLVVQHLLQAVDNTKVGLEAINSLTSVTELCKEHSYFQSVEQLVAFYSAAFPAINHETVIQKFIGAMVQFGLSLASPDAKNQFIKTVFEVLLKRLEFELANASNNSSIQLSIRCKELENIVGVLELLLSGDKHPELNPILPTVAAFINQTLDIINRMLQVCQSFNAQFDAQTSTVFDLCLRSLKNTYPLIIKTALNSFPLSLQPGFLGVLEQGIKLFIAHPTTNSILLSLWANTLEQYTKRSQQNRALDNWLESNYSSFCDYCLMMAVKNDPDIIKNCFQVHLAVLIYQPRLFWSDAKAIGLYELALQSLAVLNERVMQKIVVFFLEQLVRQSINMPIPNRPDFAPLLKVLFNCLPQLNPLTFIPCAHILSDLIPVTSEPQFVLQELLKNSQGFRQFPQPKINLLARALQLYTKTKDDRNIKSTLIAACNLASSNLHDMDIWMGIELNFEKNSRAYRAYLKNQQLKK